MNDRESRTITIPEGIHRRAHADYVTYTAITGQGDAAKAVFKKHAACYADYMRQLPTTGFKLEPDEDTKECFLPGDLYLEWVEACRSSGLIPKEVTGSINDKDGLPRMEIPNKGYPRHRVYSALCAYRFAESFSHMPYCVVMSMRQWPHLPFWQHLFYAMGRFGCGSGHSWSYVCPVREDSMTGSYGGGWNLAQGLAAVRLFLMEDEALHKHDSDYTYSDIHNIAEAISPSVMAGNYANYPSMIIPASPDDPKRNTVLDDHWIPIWDYLMGQARKHDDAKVAKTAKEIYAEISAKDPVVPAVLKRIDEAKATYLRQQEEAKKGRYAPQW